MTDAHRPSDDELVSAYLDGEATPEEAARVEREPALQARLETFRAGAALVADAPVADPGARDAHLRQARQALSSGAPVASDATVHDLATVRRRRTRTFILSAAAVIAALVLGAGLLPRLLDDGGEEQMTAVGRSADDEADAGADRSTAEESAPAAAPESAVPSTSAAQDFTDSAAAPLPDLGSFATRAELDAALDEELTTTLERAAPEAGALPLDLALASGCASDVTAQDAELVDLVYGSTAELAGVAVEVLVFTTDPASSANGPLRRYLVDRATCLSIADGVATLDP